MFGSKVLFNPVRQLVGALLGILISSSFSMPLRADGKSWTFTTETVDVSTGFTSLMVDSHGNVHLAYTNPNFIVSYAFRDAQTSKWFHIVIDKRASFASLALDSQENPHICYTQAGMHYAHWDGKDWQKEQIAQGAGTIAYSCSVAVSSDGVPHVTWYQERTPEDTNYLHMRYARLENGAWLVKTLDWDAQTGKWHTMALDKAGNPHISYDAFVSGQLKYAVSDGKEWHLGAVDSRANTEQPLRGMGNSLVLDSKGLAMISYYEQGALKYARQKEDGTWSIETLASVFPSVTWAGYRSKQALDSQGFPHVVYEDAGTLRHTYWDGQAWRAQLIVRQGMHRLRYSAIAIGSDDTIYISYCDPDDGSLQIAVGHPSVPSAANQAGKKTSH
jgi:hypothetical protein